MSVPDQLREKYLQFCASPLRNSEMIERDLDKLLKNPDVASIAFNKPHILMVGTRPVIIEDEGQLYKIGEFIFFLVRRRQGRVWETAFRFANVTSAIYEKDLPVYMHPHIVIEEDTYGIEMHTGNLCIATGRFEIYHALRKGHINTAVTALMTALRTYGTGQPFCSVINWPTIREISDV